MIGPSQRAGDRRRLGPKPEPLGQPSEGPIAQVADGQDAQDFALTLIASRQNISPRRLAAPAPTNAQLQAMLGAAAAAPYCKD